MPSTSTITTFYEFIPQTVIKSSYVNANFQNFRGNILPINTDSASSSNLSHDLGASDHYWKSSYIQEHFQKEITTGSIPPANSFNSYFKSDGKKYKKNSAAAERAFLDTDLVLEKGDLLVGLGANTLTALTIGANDYVLTADSSTATGMAWKANAGNPLSTKGDLFCFDTAAARVPVGSDGKVLTADSTAALGLSYQPALAKNYIINGAFDNAQRGTYGDTTIADTVQYKAIDRFWIVRQTQANDLRQLQQAGTNSRYAMMIRRTPATTGTGRMMTGYTLESNDAIKLSGKQVTLSFWAKKGANYSEANSQLTVHYVTGTGVDEGTQTGAPFLIGGWAGRVSTALTATTLTTTLTRFSYTFTIPSGTKELLFSWSFVPVGTAGADDSFTLENVMLNEGSVAMPFQTAGANYQQELAMCERYYQTNYYFTGVAQSSAQVMITGNHRTLMRAAPIVLIVGGSVLTMVAGASSFSQSSFGHTDYLTTSGYQMALINFTGLTVGAMLVNNLAGSGVGLAFSAEL